MSRDDYVEAQFICLFGHVKSISKVMATGILLLCTIITGFGFCSTSHAIVIVAGTAGCFATLILLLLIIGVMFDKPTLICPFLIVGVGFNIDIQCLFISPSKLSVLFRIYVF